MLNYPVFLFPNLNIKSEGNFQQVPEHEKREAHKETECSAELRHERGDGVEEDLLPLDDGGLGVSHVYQEVLGPGVDGAPGQ